ncbi:bifunctional diguanylate cyclase/phosphodiesterase [uncultured Roseovarius sp.]|uniref:putative bifunctional diguanylate cyclase/phosphodiesterase n=1 Tax=uncultured Roseovarius sp. TaxID=293344 RepID=UPI00262A2AAC|nr:bifunctional diguanylate cyclase/phosphodiesterase [uncultured Roseovarius sp.]
MRNEKIDIQAAVPLLSAMRCSKADTDGNFAFARRLRAAIWVYDIDNSRIVYANVSACDLWQAPDEVSLLQRDLAKDMSSTVASRLRQYQSDFVARDAMFNEMWTLYPKGKPTSVMVFFSGFRLADGRMAMLCEAVGNAEDEPENLRSAEALLHTDVMITLYEKNGPPLYMNPAARNAAADAQQSIAEKFTHPFDYKKMIEALEASGEHRMVSSVSTSTGQRWYDLSAKMCSDAVTGKPAILVTAVDVSELKIARDKARYLADRDLLTGCYNRSYLHQHMSRLEQCKSERGALLCFDVDHFKQINDRFGHEMGDVVLKDIAVRARSSIRENDKLVRLGGDEFVIIFDDTPPETEFAPIVERLLEHISQPIIHDSTRTCITVSIGVATFSPKAADFTAIMREADIALYASKQAGRNQVTFFSEEMGVAALARQNIETEIKIAVEQRNFVLHFQPRVDLQTGKVVSAEALVRWQHPERGMIMPDEFIPICEETGMIEDLGQMVLALGCEQAIAWQQEGLDIQLSLNISPRQFDDQRLMKSLQAFSKDMNFPHGKIELEITENVLIGDLGHIETKLEAISQMGYRIAIDDFGTGYSNLSYISEFPLNCLKIDQSFISQLPKSGPIISLILTLAKQIGATVVAEGVETGDQLAWLSRQNCEQVQGYHLSRPVPIDQFRMVMNQLNSVTYPSSKN